ncbi:SMC5-SMC6 complex localization factor protein 1 [Varanus komodoensis]|uniref:SMC5-SMC6 complex localization factor protein 1 n=1 Tax=Varanus komodoensis TaxID=61221 RepID=UPI001CF7ACD7|nr:SMC5-SMC6 complex localization factor protein 1 [Varanus komodoensis]XP_044301684.1 SMC5-SMC6 complex localization factor protein 1 [Varanus komodoensis]
MESGNQIPRIQLTGFKKEEKKFLVQLLLKLNCAFFDTEQYRSCTHLIAKQPCKSEKFLAACAAGKWILTKDYIINSAESGRWLDETTYEWGYKIEKGSHYSPQMQSAPKRWREELTRSGAAGAFHRWKVVLLVIRSDKRKDSLIRVLEAGKATICAALSESKDITHVLTNNSALNGRREKHLFGVHYYPVRYLGSYLLENEIKNDIEIYQKNNLTLEQESRNMNCMHLGEVRSTLIKHMYFQQVMLSKYTQMNDCRIEVKNAHSTRNNILEELVDNHLFPIAITEFLSGKDLIPPTKLLHSLLQHILQEYSVPTLPAQYFHIMYALLQHNPPWKSPSMLRYYLDVLQCPVCMRGTWSLIEMLVRSCLFYDNICHSVPVPEIANEERTFHKDLLMFIMNLFQAEVLALTRSLYEGMDLQHLEILPQTVLLKTFWLGTETVFFTKQINILVDWVIISYREKYKANNAFKNEVAELLSGILGAVVEYWIISGFIIDRNTVHPVADDLASYIAISCDDFSPEQLKMFISSIPSQWLEMFVAEAVFKLNFHTITIISSEPLSLQKMVCSYLPALQVGMRETGKLQKAKKKKIGQWPCPESQRALLILNGDKQNQAKVLPDVPIQTTENSVHVPKKSGNKAGSTENCLSTAKQTNLHKVNLKGETALHIACKGNNVKKLIPLLSLPGMDINVKDYAGWTPLHEACNHGSTVCVREILQRCPEVNLFSHVDGVTPLHDALVNGHVEIAELLLQHGGPALLQLEDSEGNLPLDLVECETTKHHLLEVAMSEGERAEAFQAQVESNDCDQTEIWTALFCKMLLNFCSVYNLFRPLSVTFKKLGCSDPFDVSADSCKFNTNSSGHWFVDLYSRELETFQNLPGYLQKIIEDLKSSPEEQRQAFVATLQQISMTVQMSSLYLANKFPS